jgi:4-amino-4-deoxy-L-arabinose transferase-like glycosyltransferase
MSLRLYLLVMSFMTALCAVMFGYIVFTVDPETTNSVGFFLFYLSLFLLISGATAIIGFIIRFIIFRHELVINTVKVAFRQSFFFAGFIIAALFLLSRNLFSWLNLAILIIGLSALEFFLLSYSKTKITNDIQEENNINQNGI